MKQRRLINAFLIYNQKLLITQLKNHSLHAGPTHTCNQYGASENQTTLDGGIMKAHSKRHHKQ